MVCDTLSHADAKTGADTKKTDSENPTEILDVGEERGEYISNTVALEERIVELEEGQTGSDPSKTPNSRPPPEQELMKEDQAGSDPGQSHVALTRPNPEPMNEDFIATVYPQVHESLKHTTEEHVHMENLLSLTRTLSSMKSLDNFISGDQFIADKSPEDELGNANMETKVEPIINLSPPKPISSPVQTPTVTTTTATTTTTLPLPPPPQQQRTTEPELAARVLSLKKRYAEFEQKNKTLENSTQNLGFRIFKLELRDLPHKINQTVNEVVKEAVQTALQAPLQDRFRDLPI
ncbi:hypothetical protein Tco_1409959 [Tanacetum coccineum]